MKAPPRRTRARQAEGPAPDSHTLDVVQLIPWARGIARWVGADYAFRRGSAQEQDLEGVAIEALVDLFHRFDESKIPPGKSHVDGFKGWAAVEIRSRLRWHAVQLRNGGTFKTTNLREVRAMNVQPLPTFGGNDGFAEVSLPWPERDEPRELATERGRELFEALVRLDHHYGERKKRWKRKTPIPLSVVVAELLVLLFGETRLALQRPAPAGANPTRPGLSRFRKPQRRQN
jgi:hypothetical protein